MKESNFIKKYIIVFVIMLMAMVTLIGNSTSKHITFPFAKTDIVEVEMYHYEGVPAAEECKIITGQEDVKVLYEELQNIKVRDNKKEHEIEALFLDNAEPEWKLISCVSVYDFAYDRVGAVSYTEDDTGYVNVAFIDENGIMPRCGIEAAFDENPELTYHGNGEVTFNVCSKDGVKYKQKIVFSKCDDQVNFVSESLE